MMRKLYLLVIGSAMLVAFTGLSSSAQAVVFPDCEQYGNQFGIQEFSMNTNSNVAYAPSGSTGVALACGAGPYWPWQNADSLYENAVMTYPPGMRFTNTSRVPSGSYVGSSHTGAIGFLGGVGDVILNKPTTVLAYPPGEPNGSPFCDDDANGVVVACYFANAEGIGYGYQAIRKTRVGGQTQFKLWIYPIVSIVGDYTVAKIDWNFCDYYGQPGTELCGSKAAGDLPTAYNGRPSAPDCNGGVGPNGIFSAIVTNRRGDISDPATDCAAWTRNSFEFTEAPAPGGNVKKKGSRP